jgi:hypothetical protein
MTCTLAAFLFPISWHKAWWCRMLVGLVTMTDIMFFCTPGYIIAVISIIPASAGCLRPRMPLFGRYGPAVSKMFPVWTG